MFSRLSLVFKKCFLLAINAIFCLKILRYLIARQFWLGRKFCPRFLLNFAVNVPNIKMLITIIQYLSSFRQGRRQVQTEGWSPLLGCSTEDNHWQSTTECASEPVENCVNNKLVFYLKHYSFRPSKRLIVLFYKLGRNGVIWLFCFLFLN